MSPGRRRVDTETGLPALAVWPCRMRFTVVRYAVDLECPGTAGLLPRAQALDRRPSRGELAVAPPAAVQPHEPAATAGARLVECAARRADCATFAGRGWLYSNTRWRRPACRRACAIPTSRQPCRVVSTRSPDAVIPRPGGGSRRAGHRGHAGLKLRDRESGKTPAAGSVEGDALLSAIDLLAGSTTAAEPPIPQTCPPALPVTCPGSHRSSRLRRGLVRVDQNPFASHPFDANSYRIRGGGMPARHPFPSPSSPGVVCPSGALVRSHPLRFARSLVIADSCPESLTPDRRPARRLDHPAGHHPAGEPRVQGRSRRWAVPLPCATTAWETGRGAERNLRRRVSRQPGTRLRATVPGHGRPHRCIRGWWSSVRWLNASALILAHQHPREHRAPRPPIVRSPSGWKSALATVDVRVLITHRRQAACTVFSFIGCKAAPPHAHSFSSPRSSLLPLLFAVPQRIGTDWFRFLCRPPDLRCARLRVCIDSAEARHAGHSSTFLLPCGTPWPLASCAALFGPISGGRRCLLLTDSRHPVQTPAGVRIIES